MLMINFVEEAKKELQQEKEEMAKEVIKERLRELEMAEMVLRRLKDRYQVLLSKGVEEVLFEEEE